MDISQVQELQRANARLTELITNLKGGVLLEDETRHVILVNQAFCDMFSVPAEPSRLIGLDCSRGAEDNKVLFKDPEGFVQRIDVLLQERQIVTEELVELRDGRMFSRDYIPIFHSDKFIGHLWHYHDVTDNLQNQYRWERMLRFEAVNRDIIRLFLQLDDLDEAVNRALALTGELLDVSRVYVFRFRENERILDNTHEWCAPGVQSEIENLKGLPFDELVPSFYPLIAQYDLIAPRHIDELPDDLRGILEPQNIQTVLWIPLYLNSRIEGFVGYDEIRHPRKWLPEEITLARIIVESYARALEREQAARMLVNARDEAIRTAQLRAQFVANMSHEIRTPMTGTLGMLELLLETELSDLQQEFATEAFNSSSRLLNIINDILDFSKLEAGQIVLDASPIDLSAIATEVKMTLAPQIKDKPVELRLDIDPQTPYRVFGDATRIRQVLMNLAGNAVKFTASGHVTLSIKVTRFLNEIACLRFSVQDTGIGIPPESMHRIFESFVQADGSTTRKYGGSGLGLSISKQLVELMGGSIHIESAPGAGSTFSFILRLPIAQVNSLQSLDPVRFCDLSVLIIDNNRTARYVLAQQLENWGVRVTQTHEVDAGYLEQWETAGPFDIVFQRYDSSQGESGVSKITPDLAQQIVYITHDQTPPVDETVLRMRWPIDQSSLYNLLVQTISAHAPKSTPSPARLDGTVRGRILLADDNPINVDLVIRVLTDMDIQVHCVDNGQEALDQLQQVSYDLVLMDMHMPVLDGMEATRRIRQSQSPYCHIPILALTASVMRDEQDHYLAMGVNEVITKPFLVKHFREVVNRWLQQVRSTTIT